MFKPGFTLLLLICSSLCQAQPEVSIFAGPQLTSAKYTVNDIKQPVKANPSVMFGAAMKVEFDNQLYFFPSVYYNHKGYKVTLNNPSFPPTELAKNNNTSIHTIEVLPLLQFDFNKKPAHSFVRFGPSIDFAIYGYERFDARYPNGSERAISRPMVFSFADYGYVTASVNFHLGYENPDWMIFGFYQHGFGSFNNADGGPVILHRVAGAAFGWKLWK